LEPSLYIWTFEGHYPDSTIALPCRFYSIKKAPKSEFCIPPEVREKEKEINILLPSLSSSLFGLVLLPIAGDLTRASHILGKCCSTELYPWPLDLFFKKK
jgi:hypothetical protein